jgi:hypothetical protein
MDAVSIGVLASALMVTGIIGTWAWRSLTFLSRVDQRLNSIIAIVENTDGEIKFLRDSYWWLMAKIGQGPPIEPVDKKPE